MKNTQSFESRDIASDDMLPEYDFDYSRARPNRFANRFDSKDRLVVILDPDITRIFTSPEAVNAVLRALIATMPGIAKPETIGESPAGP